MTKEKNFLSSIVKNLQKNIKDIEIIENSSLVSIKEFINTGNYIFNAHLSGSLFGGIPSNRSVLIAGEPGTGKTFLSLNICRESQKMGYDVFYFDSEAAIDVQTTKSFGIDGSKFAHILVNTVQDFGYYINNLILEIKKTKESNPDAKFLIVLDSLGNLSSSQEKNIFKENKDAKDMTKQQLIRSVFRTITTDLSKMDVPFIVTNHIYQNMTNPYAGAGISGGLGAIFNASIVVVLNKAKLKEDDGNKNENLQSSGIIVTSSIYKSRFTKPIKVRFKISNTTGMNKYVGLEQYVSFETCGVGRGVVLTQKEFEKQKHDKYYEINTKDGKMYFIPKDTARQFIVYDNEEIKEVPLKEFFTSKVFSENVLKKLDENIIKPTFKLPENIKEDNEGIDDLIEK
jgi:RecA/RadA recombinase